MDILFKSSNTTKSQTAGAPRASLGAGFEEEDCGEQLHREMVVHSLLCDVALSCCLHHCESVCLSSTTYKSRFVLGLHPSGPRI